MITVPQLISFAPSSAKYAEQVVKWFNEYACKYEVNTPLRVAAILAQLIHESGSFRYVRELASGSAYEGRKDLGNIFKGDGVRFKGRGYIQITGRSNYKAVSKALFGDEDVLIKTPDLLAAPQYAMQSAFWYWDSRKLNQYADKQWVETITKKINGGLNGFADRVTYYNRICKEFGLPLYKIAA